MGIWDDDVAPARSAFLTIKDLFNFEDGDDRDPVAGDTGRLLLIKPLSSGERQSNMVGGEAYTYVECDVAVLDGPVTEMIPEVPGVVEAFQFSGKTLTSLLLPKLRSGKSVLGRIGAHRPQNFRTVGWHLDPPTEEDFKIAEAFRERMRSEEKAKADKRRGSARAVDPFAAPGDDEGGGAKRAAAPWNRG